MIRKLVLTGFLVGVPLVLLASCSGGGGGGPAGPVDLPLAEFGLSTRAANPSCVAFARPPQSAPIRTEAALNGLRFDSPLFAAQAPHDSTRWYVVEKAGLIRTFRIGDTQATVFADLRDRVDASAPESGLLGMAFHPDFGNNRQVFLSYTHRVNTSAFPFTSYVSRFSADSDTSLNTGSEQPLITLDQPFENHNGGHVAFGPDGYLYIGFGDGGSGGDPGNRAQNTTVLFGKILRIDVNNGDPYAIPPDNPFANDGGANRGEIFAWGLRNPWRFHFDRASNAPALWLGDVGQNAYEEINLVVRGGNYGWNVREGAHCYPSGTSCANTFIDPVVEYAHAGGGRSVTGGFVYRGDAIPALRGVYLYADFITGEIFRIAHDNNGAAVHTRLLATAHSIASFAQDNAGELYVVDYAGGGIHRIAAAAPPAADTFPRRLSQTGCMQAERPSEPRAGLIPYDVNVPFWSDGADKQRWLALPDNTRIHIATDGDWEFPIGTVLVKQFRRGDRLLETRLFMRHDDGDWGGYSYEWNADQSDAIFVEGGKTAVIDGQPWTFPSSGQCLQCHTVAAGRALGPETAQMNRLFNYYSSGWRANQLRTYEHIGLFDGPVPGSPPALPATGDGQQPVATRARAYLHANCAHCHQPAGTGRGPADFRFSTVDPGICNVAPTAGDLGIANAMLLAPGEPARSIVWERLRRRDGAGMPPVASHSADPHGVELIAEWIAGKTSCP